MNLLVPLGLLGLLGIVALIVIYLIKPNYQQKVVSSTYVWKLSLKYRKKRLPVGRIRNLLIFVCQVAIITSLAMVLARPVTPGGQTATSAEKVLVIDASANMHASVGGQTRFDRAAELASAAIESAFEQNGGSVTLIVARENTDVLYRRAGADKKQDLLAAVTALAEQGCSYATGDIGGAMEAAQGVLDENPLAEVLLYTATKYDNPGTVNVVDVSADGEWNAAILEVNKNYVENVYSFDVTVAAYGRETILPVYCTVDGVNGNKSKTLELVREVRCTADNPVTVTFASAGTDDDPGIYSYSSVQFRVEAADSMTNDNTYYLYDGTKPEMKFQYSSSSPNKFWIAAMESLRNALRDNWDFADPEEVFLDGSQGAVEPATEGFDFYIFEGKMPDKLPRYGTILLVNPQNVPSDGGFRLGGTAAYGTQLKAGSAHAVTEGVNPDEITVNAYMRVTSYDAYDTLLYCGGDPALMFKTERTSSVDRHIAIITFSPNYSDLTLTVSFASLFYNLFQYTQPTAVTDSRGLPESVFEVGQSIVVTARGTDLKVTGPDGYTADETTFAGSVFAPGTYIVTQIVLPDGTQTTRFFVKIASSESNIFAQKAQIDGDLRRAEVPDDSYDWLFWLALALVALITLEWALQAKENF